MSQNLILRELSNAEVQAIWDGPGAEVFADTLDFRYRDWLSPEARAQQQALGARLGEPYRLQLGAFSAGELAGWSVGVQESAEAYYMVNSAVLPAYRRQGVYSALIAATLETLVPLGFQRIYSRHVACNNAVIIPKLQAGFMITGVELNDRFGTLVHLTYFPNPARRKVLEFRMGQSKPDPEVREYLGF